MTRRLVVLEANEVPLRVFRQYADAHPDSSIAALLADSLTLTTEARDVADRDLYPSQSWASMNSGLPFDEHRIRWYNDPKPATAPFIWRTIADHGLSVGAVGTLHSSHDPKHDGDPFAFLVPDSFAPNAYTTPRSLEPLQAMNLEMTARSGRVADTRVTSLARISLLRSLPTSGITPWTYAHAASTLLGIAARRVSRERLRSLQFPVLADVFMKQVRRHRPDLGVLFTNHVAASLHRYWYAQFPEDYPIEVFDREWVDRFAGEIPAALRILDRYIGKLMSHCARERAILVVVSSMGQCANTALPACTDRTRARFYRVDDVRSLVAAIAGETPPFDVRPAMVPQYTLGFETADAAAGVERALAERTPESIRVRTVRNESVLTLTIRVDADRERFVIDGTSFDAADLGLSRLRVADQHSGRHHRDGTLIVFNSSTAQATTDRVDYLEYAPAVLEHFGIEPDPRMRRPTFTI